MRYGGAYQGSKNAIVPWVVNQLPPAEVFVVLDIVGKRNIANTSANILV